MIEISAKYSWFFITFLLSLTVTISCSRRIIIIVNYFFLNLLLLFIRKFLMFSFLHNTCFDVIQNCFLFFFICFLSFDCCFNLVSCNKYDITICYLSSMQLSCEIHILLFWMICIWYFEFNDMINKCNKCSDKKIHYNCEITSQKINKKMIKWNENEEIEFEK